MEKVTPYAKSIVGFLLAGLTAAGTALTDGTITASEWVAIAVAALSTFGVVFVVPNAEPSTGLQVDRNGDDVVITDGEREVWKGHVDESKRNEDGVTTLGVILIVLLVLAILALLGAI